MKKFLLPLLLFAGVASAQYGPLTVNGPHVSLNAPSGGSVNIAVAGVKAFSVEGGLFYQGTSATGLTATGTTSTDALLLAANINLVTTAASGTGVRLPLCSGPIPIEVAVYNGGANPLKVYPSTGGTIDGLATDAGITLTQNTLVVARCTTALTWRSDIRYSSLSEISTGLTAAGSAQGDALALVSRVNVVTTAAASTGVRLPVGAPGLRIYVRNGGANTLSVYPETGGAINGGSVNAAASLASGKSGEFICTALLTWVSLPGA